MRTPKYGNVLVEEEKLHSKKERELGKAAINRQNRPLNFKSFKEVSMKDFEYKNCINFTKLVLETDLYLKLF